MMQRLENYQASKTALFWACLGSAVLATVVGFSWGGWVTGSGAQTMAENAATQARAELATVVCVDRFMSATDAPAQLLELKNMEKSYERGKLIEAGGWAVMPGGDADAKPTSKATSIDRKTAGLCAEQLVLRDTPAAGAATKINSQTTVQ
jgi:hypothetical protein